MCASPLDLLRAGLPPPRVVLLPDALFFVRSVPVSPDPSADQARQWSEVGGLVDLALEAVAPFPLSQLYYGYHWRPGARRALAFAAYRRRFTTEQTEGWARAELVLPCFAALLGGKVQPLTTVVLAAPEGLTAIHWDSEGEPVAVAFRPLGTEATEDDRAREKLELLRQFESKAVVELTGPPVAEAGDADSDRVFVCGDFASRVSGETAAALDVRDKEELVLRRRAHSRDLLLWRVGMGCVAAFILLALCEVALVLGGLWQKTQHVRLNAQAATVEKIMTASEVVAHINDLSNKRLLPMEMISIVSSKKPASTQFIRATTTSLYTLMIDAQTTNAGEIGVYRNDLAALPACASVEIKNPQTRENVATFTLVVTFKPDAIKPASAPPS